MSMTAREAMAQCLASVENYPEEQDYGLADDLLLALANAGLCIIQLADSHGAGS